MTNQQKEEVVSGDVAPLLRRASDRVGSEADPIHPQVCDDCGNKLFRGDGHPQRDGRTICSWCRDLAELS